MVLKQIHEESFFDLLLTKLFVTALLLTFEVTLVLRNVAINILAGSLAPSPSRVNVTDPAPNVNLSSVKTSVDPSDLTRVYLSSSNGRNDSFASAVNVGVEPSVIVVEYCFLITILVLVRSIDEIFFLGKIL